MYKCCDQPDEADLVVVTTEPKKRREAASSERLAATA